MDKCADDATRNQSPSSVCSDMRCWTEQDGTEAVIGDEPLDIAAEMLSAVIKAYEDDMGRKPTVTELDKVLASSIRSASDKLLDEADDREVTAVSIRLKKRPRRQRFAVGDYVAIPLPSGGHGYARVKDIHRGWELVFLDFLDAQSDRPMPVEQLRDRPVLMDDRTDWSSIHDWSWQVLGGDASAVMADPAAGGESADDRFRRYGDDRRFLYGSGLIPAELERALRERGTMPE